MKIFQVDAFAETVFSGNPAAVIPLDQWLDDATMQNIAMENNLAETAFIVRQSNGFHIRWFTPTIEVDLCGHATLATAHVLFNHLGIAGSFGVSLNVNNIGGRVCQEDLLDSANKFCLPDSQPR